MRTPPGLTALLIALSFLDFRGEMRAADAAPAPVVLLKLDDLVRQKGGPQSTVSARWQRTTDFLEGEKIKASYGIITETMDSDCPGYVAWIKQRVANGFIEMWHHAYYGTLPEELKVDGRSGEYVGGTAEVQAATFRKAFTLIKEKTGLEVAAFGPHTTALDGATYEALESFPNLKLVWFYGPPKGMKTNKLVIQRLMELEKPLFFPNPDQLKENFEKKRATLPYVAIQGHPNQWDDERFENFKKAVLYLREQGCPFVTPSEYVASHPPAK